MVTSLLTHRRLRIWLSGAVLTTWSLTLKTVEMIVDFRRNPPPTHHHEQHCYCSGVIQIPGHHHLPGLEVGHSHGLHCEKGPAEVLPSSAEEVQPATGAESSLNPLHINICLVQFSYQIWPQKTTEGSPDCWAHHWYNPPHSPRPVLIQSEQKGWKNHSGPFTSSTLLLWTVTIWSTLQSSEHQNDQTQKQFLPSGNPAHEHLAIIMSHNIYTLIYLTHIISLHFKCT